MAGRKGTRPLTLKDLKPWFLEILAQCIGNVMTQTFLFIGLAGVSKSRLAKTLGMTIAKFFVRFYESERERER